MVTRLTKNILECRICADSPLMDLFNAKNRKKNKRGSRTSGGGPGPANSQSVNVYNESAQNNESRESRKSRKSGSKNLNNNNDTDITSSKRRSRSAGSHGDTSKKYRTRSSSEVKDLVENLWLPHVHSRAWDAFKTDTNLIDFLTSVAKSVPKDRDPIVSDAECVTWLGTYIDDEPCVGIMKPGQPGRTQTFVNRILAFVFASDDSFEKLQTLSKDPLKTTCGNKECINLAHIAIWELLKPKFDRRSCYFRAT